MAREGPLFFDASRSLFAGYTGYKRRATEAFLLPFLLKAMGSLGQGLFSSPLTAVCSAPKLPARAQSHTTACSDPMCLLNHVQQQHLSSSRPLLELTSPEGVIPKGSIKLG